MKPKDELPSLPDELIFSFRVLHRVTPSHDLVEETLANLHQKPRLQPESSQTFVESKISHHARATRRWFAVHTTLLPAFCVSLLAILAFRGGHAARISEVSQTREVSLQLPVSGPAWMDLEISTHHHVRKPSHVEIQAPKGVHIDVEEPMFAVTPRVCDDSSCSHRWSQPGTAEKTSLRVGVNRPGYYVIHVRHESPIARVREQFVLLARR